MTRQVVSHFSKTAGTKVRRVYTTEGAFLGTVVKKDTGGYRIVRQDGKVREKQHLKDAMQSVARAN